MSIYTCCFMAKLSSSLYINTLFVVKKIDFVFDFIKKLLNIRYIAFYFTENLVKSNSDSLSIE